MSEEDQNTASEPQADKERWWRRAAILGTWADALARVLEIATRGR